MAHSDVEAQVWEAWARGDAETAIRHALAAAAADGAADAASARLLRVACAFALHRHRVDLLTPHIDAVLDLPTSVERDAVRATLRIGDGDLTGALALVLAPDADPDAGPVLDPRAPDSATTRIASIVHVGLGALASGAWSTAEECVRAAASLLGTPADLDDPTDPVRTALRFELLAMAAVVEAHTDTVDTAFRALEAALVPLRTRNRLTARHALALICLGDVQLLHGDLAQAAVNLTRGARLADADRPGYRAHATIALAFIRVRQGRWADAAAAIRPFDAPDASIEQQWIRTQVLAVRGLIKVAQGDLDRGAELVAEAEALAVTTPSYIASIVVLHTRIVAAIAAGDWRALERHLDDAEEPGYRHPYRAGEWRALRLLAVWHLGNRAEFGRRLNEWGADLRAATDPYYWAFAAILAEHQHRFTDGLSAIERALDHVGADQDPLGRAWVRMVAGTYLSRYGDGGSPDPARALGVYDAARDELRAIGATAFTLRCDVIIAAVTAELERERRSDPAAVLTEQQRRIARAVAQGYTSDEIASIEHLSKRTIDYHVRNILERLGITSRREIARLLGAG